MSRTISIVVLLAVIAPSFLIFASQLPVSQDKLPACCRRDGKHHCAMMDAMSQSSSSENQMKAEPETCPYRSQATVVPAVAAYLPSVSSVFFAALQSHPAIHAQTEAVLRVAESRSHQKRGPPSNTSC